MVSHHHLPLVLLLTVSSVHPQEDLFGVLEYDRQNQGSPCYGRDEITNEVDLTKPMRCEPPFKNVVADSPVKVTPPEMTCGLNGPAPFCLQTGGYYRECSNCDAADPLLHHNATYLTDVEEDEIEGTHWQSVTMYEMVQGVNVSQEVNLTINLGKAFDITYVRLKFSSPRPESFAIYKKNRRNPWRPDMEPEEGWIPWQFYSAYCEDQFKVPDTTSIIQPRAGPSGREQIVMEDRALCTSEFSDISPLSGGNVAFATLDGRPGAYNFDDRPELQQWVSATDVRISLMRLNTFGDEVFRDERVLRSYYYGITHVVVGGRCKCNGHSNVCINSSPDEVDEQGNPIPVHPKCLCQHGTTGDDCGSCLDDHWDRPWKRATTNQSNPCLPCDCNGWSSKCRFNEELYRINKRGGECLDCEGNRSGAHCEICMPDTFPSPVKDALGRQECISCNCDPSGSLSSQCRDDGSCECKPGVTGKQCNMCEANYWSFPGPRDPGCKSCECMVEGSLNNMPSCQVEDGRCQCKQNVEGQRCDRCKSGHFQTPQLDNEFGCTPCFCFGHTAACLAAPNYFQSLITSDFNRGPDDWEIMEEGVPAIQAQTPPFEKAIVLQSDRATGYFLAPEKFLGDRRASHNQELKFRFRLGGEDTGARSGQWDIVIEGGGATPIQISLAITDQNNPLPTRDMQTYTFRLHENTEFGWSPSLNSKTFVGLLSNITSIKIRGSYTPQGKGFLDEVQMGTATIDGEGKKANWVEYCECPPGFEGQFCERCSNGYYHENNGGKFARCIPCMCNGHSDTCDPETGVCDCQDNTGGDQCGLCADGYFGEAIAGEGNTCQACPCPSVLDEKSGEWRPGMCFEMIGNEESPLCTECPEGRTGSRCELCVDGFFGDPLGLSGERKECDKCDCNDNVDKSAIGNCDRTSGKCLRCIDDTAGDHCEKCKSGFYGDALVPRSQTNKKNCNVCQCNPWGTHHTDDNHDGIDELPICNPYTGKCKCKDNVVGQNCETCRDGYWDLRSGQGCKDCNCNVHGSYNSTCDIITGQCHCRPGVVGAQCDQCQAYHYGFSDEGCKSCDCDPTGSTSYQCDLATGQCPCRDKVEGRRCDRCEENTKTRTRDEYSGPEKVCEPCDDCYNLVQNATDDIRNSLTALTGLLTAIAENPEPVGADFDVNLRKLQLKVKRMVEDAQQNAGIAGSGEGVLEKFEKLQKDLEEVGDVVRDANTQLDRAKEQSDHAGENVARAESLMSRAKDTLNQAQSRLDQEGKEAYRRAEDIAERMGTGNALITEVAQKARKLAAEQSENASEVESIAKQAKEESQAAYNKAFSARDERDENKNEIRKLKHDLNVMTTKLDDVQNYATSTLSAADASYKEALQNKLLALRLEVPEAVTSGQDTFVNTAEIVKANATRIRDSADTLIKDKENVTREVMNKRAELGDLLMRSEAQQQQLDLKIAQMDEYRNEAKKAVELGNSVLSQAKDTLKVLEEFDSKVNQTRAEFKDIINERTTNEIERTLADSNTKTAKASDAIKKIDGDTYTAFDIANESKEKAEEASKEAKRIVEESHAAKSVASELKEAAKDMENKLATTTDLVNEKESIALIDASLATEALKEANKAQNSSGDASAKVVQAKAELDEITVLLENIDDPDPLVLADLSRRLDEAERKFEEADLEQRLIKLEDMKQEQITRKTELRKEYESVKAEVEVIAGIIEKLPNSCPSIHGDHSSGMLEN